MKRPGIILVVNSGPLECSKQPGKLKEEIRDLRIGRIPRDDRRQLPHFRWSLVQVGRRWGTPQDFGFLV